MKSFETKYSLLQTSETPLNELIENHLGLGLEITDFGHPTILGQLDIGQNLIRINIKLDPYTSPRLGRRYNFTLVHEACHQILHRFYISTTLCGIFDKIYLKYVVRVPQRGTII